MFSNFKKSGSGTPIVVKSPSTGEVLSTINSFTEEEAKDAIKRAKEAQAKWQEVPLNERIKILKRFQHILVKETDDVCKIIASENGKPMQEALQTEILPINILTGYFLKRAKKLLADKKIPISLIKYRKSFINYRPRGIVLVISPWNYPFSIPTGTIIMGLLAGNAIIHKPASLTPLIALKTRELFDKAGLSPDLYQVIPSSGALGSKMIEMGVDYVNFTGSTQVGLKISEMCGRLMIPCSMELGGKNPAIVCEDADIKRAAATIVFGGLTNAGQTCASIGRVYAHETVYEKIVQQVVERVKKFRIGNSMEKEVDIGPIVDKSQLDIIETHIKDAVSKGAKILVGGKRVEGSGQFFEPTVLVNVTDDMLVVNEETFGPVIPIMKFDSYKDAIYKSNNSVYGLTAYIFSENRKHAQAIAKKIQAGTVMINDALITFGIPETPWQGVKMSGTGRTHSDEGFLHLCYPYHINEDSTLKLKKSLFWQPYSTKTYNLLKFMANLLYGKS